MKPFATTVALGLLAAACGGTASPAAVASAPVAIASAAPTAAPAARTAAGGGMGYEADYGYGYGGGYGAAAAATPVALTGAFTIVDNTKLGRLLAAPNGMIVYTYKLDKPNTTSCVGQCARDWPPVLITTGAPVAAAGMKGTLGVITRPDGSKQITYNGFPLHFFAGDQKPGDANGEAFGDVWSTVKGP